MSELKKCPICHEQAKIGYACGDYFAHCSDGCPSPMCDHASESTTVCAWNDWAEWCEKNRRAQPENEPLTLEELRQMEGEPVYVVTLDNPLENQPYWAIAGINSNDSRHQNGVALYNRVQGDWGAFDLYGDTWLAYRRKPERSEG